MGWFMCRAVHAWNNSICLCLFSHTVLYTGEVDFTDKKISKLQQLRQEFIKLNTRILVFRCQNVPKHTDSEMYIYRSGKFLIKIKNKLVFQGAFCNFKITCSKQGCNFEFVYTHHDLFQDICPTLKGNFNFLNLQFERNC